MHKIEKHIERYQEVIPENVRRIMSETSRDAKVAWDELDKIKPDGMIKFPDGDIQEDEYFPVYNAGSMMRMFQAGMAYARKLDSKEEDTETPVLVDREYYGN